MERQGVGRGDQRSLRSAPLRSEPLPVLTHPLPPTPFRLAETCKTRTEPSVHAHRCLGVLFYLVGWLVAHALYRDQMPPLLQTRQFTDCLASPGNRGTGGGFAYPGYSPKP